MAATRILRLNDFRQLSQREVVSLLLLNLPEVHDTKEIYVLKEFGYMYHVWIVVPEKTADIQKKVEQQIRYLTQKYFKEDIFIDFYIIGVSDREQVRSKGADLIFLRR